MKKYKVRVEEQVYEVEIQDLQSRPILAVVDGVQFEVWPENGQSLPGAQPAALKNSAGPLAPAQISQSATPIAGSSLTSKSVKAPIGKWAPPVLFEGRYLCREAGARKNRLCSLRWSRNWGRCWTIWRRNLSALHWGRGGTWTTWRSAWRQRGRASRRRAALTKGRRTCSTRPLLKARRLSEPAVELSLVVPFGETELHAKEQAIRFYRSQSAEVAGAAWRSRSTTCLPMPAGWHPGPEPSAMLLGLGAGPLAVACRHAEDGLRHPCSPSLSSFRPVTLPRTWGARSRRFGLTPSNRRKSWWWMDCHPMALGKSRETAAAGSSTTRSGTQRRPGSWVLRSARLQDRRHDRRRLRARVGSLARICDHFERYPDLEGVAVAGT